MAVNLKRRKKRELLNTKGGFWSDTTVFLLLRDATTTLPGTTLFLKELLELIHLHTVKWFQVLLFNTNNSVYQVFLFNTNNLISNN